ncbi:MAG: S41 family peptidase, partial [Acidimicrobiia bacterium]
MTKPFRLAIILALSAVVISSCNIDLTSPGTSGPTPTPTPTATTSTVLDSGRPLEVVSCDSAPEDMDILCESYDLIRRHYVDPLGEEFLADAATSGLDDLEQTDTTSPLVCAIPADAFAETCSVAATNADTGTEAAVAMVNGLANYALDANSVYLDEEALALVEEEQEGQIEGIGALVTAEDVSSGEAEQCSIITETCKLLIVSVISGSPAEAAGMQSEDQIVGVDGQDIEDWTLDEVTAAVRAPSGTDVVLSVVREGESLQVPITRAAIVIPVVESSTVG